MVDDRGEPVADRRELRDVVSIAALCEIAEESAFGGDLDELLAQLVALRLTEKPAGIDEAEEAVARRCSGRSARRRTSRRRRASTSSGSQRVASSSRSIPSPRRRSRPR